jgi:hypothetical protein
MFQATLSGGKELDAALRNLEQKQARKVVGASLRVGAKIVQGVATELVPVLQTPRPGRTPGKLKTAIKVRASKKRSRDGSVTIFAGPAKGFFKGDEFYGGPVEFGWKTGKRGSKGIIQTKAGKLRKLRTGAQRGAVPGFHYMEYALEEAGGAAIQAICEKAVRLVEEAVNAARTESKT